ncbi:MAG TPA: hypothetical protein VFS21_37595 [Roseiflexaceae bacterium]|nr:hypothetical protein [Roseiflexaceae bacterium]
MLLAAIPRIFITALLVALTSQPAASGGLRLLLRDEQDRGIAGATLTVRTADGATLPLMTDGQGVAVSGPLSGQAVWLVGAQLADGSVLAADSVPPEVGFRLGLIPGQWRDVLLRRDGSYLVLDPDMILVGAAAQPPPTPALLGTPIVPSGPLAGSPGALPAPAPEATPGVVVPSETGEWRGVWCLVGVGLVALALLGGALLLGLRRRRAP